MDYLVIVEKILEKTIDTVTGKDLTLVEKIEYFML